MIGQRSRFRENDDLPLRRGPVVKKKPPFSNARAIASTPQGEQICLEKVFNCIVVYTNSGFHWTNQSSHTYFALACQEQRFGRRKTTLVVGQGNNLIQI